MISPDVKILAVYDDLLEKIEGISKMAAEAGADGRDGQDGKDGRDAPVAEIFAAIAALHSDLIKEMISAQQAINVNPEITVNNGARVYEIERNNKGFASRIVSKPAEDMI